MQLRNAITAEQIKRIHNLYEEAFPASEKKPFEMILAKRETGNFEILEITDDEGCFCGLAIMMLYQNLALLDYFAIAANCRGNGKGSAALKVLQDKYADQKFILEIENTAGLTDDGLKMTQQVECLPEEEKQIRLRRKAFYLRNDMRQMDFYVDLFGVEMEILVHGEKVDFEEYYSILKSTIPPELLHRVKLL